MMEISYYFWKALAWPFKRIKRGIMFILYSFFRIFPIDKRLVLFESEPDFSDNSWALFQHLYRNNDLKIIWLCHRRDSISKVEKKYRIETVLHKYRYISLLDAWYIARARYIFFTHGITKDVYKRKNQTIFNLWHGTPIKGTKNLGKRKNPQFDNVTCIGSFAGDLVTKFLNCDKSFAVSLGCPRNDLLIHNITKGYKNPFCKDGFEGKLVLWMPTFRASHERSLSERSCDTETALPLVETENDLLNLDSFLFEIDIFILVKIHHLQANKDIFKRKFSNISFITDNELCQKGVQLYELIGKSDALLTDYSSVYVDYLLVDKPIGFILNDIDTYQKGRGEFLVGDLLSYLPGDHIYNMNGLTKFLKDISEGIDSKQDERNKIKHLMFKNTDDKSCERILNYCGLKC